MEDESGKLEEGLVLGVKKPVTRKFVIKKHVLVVQSSDTHFIIEQSIFGLLNSWVMWFYSGEEMSHLLETYFIFPLSNVQ